jgi:hypothetical protein
MIEVIDADTGNAVDYEIATGAVFISACPEGLMRVDADGGDMPPVVCALGSLQSGRTYRRMDSSSRQQQLRQHEQRFKHRDSGIVHEVSSAGGLVHFDSHCSVSFTLFHAVRPDASSATAATVLFSLQTNAAVQQLLGGYLYREEEPVKVPLVRLCFTSVRRLAGASCLTVSVLPRLASGAFCGCIQ